MVQPKPESLAALRIIWYCLVQTDTACDTLRLLSEMREGVDTRHAVVIEKSRYNQRLEDRAASLLAVQKFFEDGCLRA